MLKKTYFNVMFTILLLSLLFVKVEYSNFVKAEHNNSSPGTLVSGIISENTTWTLENSPYIVVADIVVEKSVFLKIELGVVVKFAEGTNLIIDGALVAEGNATHPITFTSNSENPTPGYWGTIKFRWKSNDNASIIDYVDIKYATVAITVEACSPLIQNSRIERNTFGVELRTVQVDSIAYIPAPKLRNCFIVNNNEAGIKFPAWEAAWVYIENCSIENNGGGIISSYFSSSSIFVFNSIIRNNKGNGIYGREIKVESSIITNNSGCGIIGGIKSNVELKNSAVTNNGEVGVYAEKSITLMYAVVSNNKAGINASHVIVLYSEIMGNSGPGISSNSGDIHSCRIFNNAFFDLVNWGILDINATFNWWGTTNETLISQKIYDYYDDYNLGKVLYKPFLVPSIVNFTFTPETPYVYETVTFNASASFDPYSSIMNYTWDFGDGTVASTSSPIVNHTFTSPGDYVVNLTVTDELGLLNSTAETVTVLQDTIAPAVANPTHMPSGDVQPHQEVKISVSVSNSLSGVKNVILSYSLDGSSWINVTMNFNSTTNIYEATIPGQEAGTMVKYKIIAYDNAGNYKIEDNNSIYYTYTVVPEFSSTTFLLILLISSLIVVTLWKPSRKRNHTKCLNQNPFFSSVCAHRSNIKLKGHFKCSLEIGHYQNFYL